ncbi:MAG: ATP-binding protein [Limisphaerales bacterium]
MPARLQLRVPAEPPAAFSEASGQLRGHLEVHGVAGRTLYAADLAFEELGTNILTHALAGRPAAAFDVQVNVETDRVRLVFEDDGPAFDPSAASPPQRPASLAEARIGGLGLEMVRNAGGRLDYSRAGGKNRLEVTIHRDGGAGTGGPPAAPSGF